MKVVGWQGKVCHLDGQSHRSSVLVHVKLLLFSLSFLAAAVQEAVVQPVSSVQQQQAEQMRVYWKVRLRSQFTSAVLF